MVGALKRSVGIAAIAMAGSLVLTAVALPLMGKQPTIITLVMCIAAPMLIAFPISYHSSVQKLRLQAALESLAEAHQSLAESARRDSLTGLLNRGAFLTAIEAACRGPDASDGMLLMVDADDFKSINDRFGHDAGDQALVAIAHAMGRSLRSRDICGRIGGEEFAVILSETSPAEARALAERLRREVESMRLDIPGHDGARLTVSIGAAALSSSSDASSVMRLADKRLYEAKKAGRNRAVLPRGSTLSASAA
ncbi:diguanylate cyclase [Chelativorans sp. ZYF759]|uniref:GGDEF domain-containing protein n=1 Tax=Chelativorans sp. ZYF759 TaxID=2692213 RepID=UPI00145D64DB|nr:GGDEF domain-containing protein [Chelativorans sp. ZYF759]NMG41748.1 diguanylate cyclase [Chelativorans sp. ZYF759]